MEDNFNPYFILDTIYPLFLQDLLKLGPDRVEIAIPNIEKKIDGKTRGIIHSKIVVSDQ